MINSKKNKNDVAVTSMSLMFTLVVAASFDARHCLASDLPTSDEIVAKMIEANGGAIAMRKVKNRVVKFHMDLGMGGMTGTGVSHFARPASMHTEIDIQGMGTIEEGVTDGVAWAQAAMTGPQIKEGSEKAMALQEANFEGLLDWKSQYKSIECVGKEKIDGKDHFKVEITPLVGTLITSYVDAETYLPRRTDLKLSTAMGEFDMVIYSEDYRPVDGVQYSRKSRIDIMGQKRSVEIQSIEHNVEMPKDRFNFPEDIKAILAKNKTDKSKPTKGKEE